LEGPNNQTTQHLIPKEVMYKYNEFQNED